MSLSRRAWVPCAAVVLAAAGAGTAVLVTRDGAAARGGLAITWSVPDRTTGGPTPEVAPRSWPLDVVACTGDARVTWRVTGGDDTATTTSDCRTRLQVPALGRYRVTASADGTTTATDVDVRDVLVVSVGDSVASGEGDPDSSAGDDGGLRWQDAQCHRSGRSGPAQAALRLERRDPHSSVTFVPLACSGATIAEGLLGPYDGIDPGADGASGPLPPQLDEAVRRADGRPIDTLLISIGANDLGFGDIVRSCVLLPDCATGRGAAQYADGIARLPGEFARLDERLDDLAAHGRLRHAVSTGYFDVATADDGSTCPGPGDGDSLDGLSRTEFAWTHDVVSPGLNTAVRDAVARAGGGADWRYLGGIAEAFTGHGYCAQDSWVRRATDSVRRQHNLTGAFHPNERGQLLGYAVRIEAALTELLQVG